MTHALQQTEPDLPTNEVFSPFSRYVLSGFVGTVVAYEAPRVATCSWGQ